MLRGLNFLFTESTESLRPGYANRTVPAVIIVGVLPEGAQGSPSPCQWDLTLRRTNCWWDIIEVQIVQS